MAIIEQDPFKGLDHTQREDDEWDEWREAQKAYKKARKELEARDYDHLTQFDFDVLKNARLRFYKALYALNQKAKQC